MAGLLTEHGWRIPRRPVLPGHFIGAGIGAIATTVTPDYANAAAVAGMTAAVIYLALTHVGVTLASG